MSRFAKTKTVLLSTSALVLWSGLAIAADVPVAAKAKPQPSGDPWTGLYFGAHIGAGTGDASSAQTDSSASASTFNTTTFAESSRFNNAGAARMSGNITGSVADLFVGYNYRAGSFVFGGQVEGTVFSDVTSKAIGTRSSAGAGTDVQLNGGVTTVTNPSFTSFGTFQNFEELRSMFTAVGRVGWLATPQTLLYALGGGTLGHFVTAAGSGEDSFNKRSKWVLGYTVGAGGEYRFTPNWSVRTEYRYVHFDLDRDGSSLSASTNASTVSASTSASIARANQSTTFDFHLGKIGIVYTPWATGTAADAYAADLSLKARPLIASADPWTGLYVGAHIGAGSGNASTTGTDASSSLSSSATQLSTSSTAGASRLNGNITGSVADLFVGYNYRAGSFVVGGQVEGTVFSDVTSKTIGTRSTVSAGTTATTTAFGTTVANSSGASLGTTESFDDLRSMFTVVARIGWLATPQTLLYALGGGTLGHFVVPEFQDPFGGKRSTWALGYTAGAGGEHHFTPNWSVRAEYRYVHFDVDRNLSSAFTNTSSDGTGTPPSTFASTNRANQSTAYDFHLGKIGIVYTPGATGTAADAYAADLPLKVRPLIASTDPWTGLYFGAHIGAGTGDASTALTDSSTSLNTFNSATQTQLSTSNNAGIARMSGDITGSVADLFVGYNHRVGSFVVGGQVEGTVFSDVTSKTIGNRSAASTGTTTVTSGGGTTVTTSSSTSFGTFQSFEDLRSMFTAVGRVGWLATPQTLLYALGGGTLGHFVTQATSGEDSFNQRSKWVLGYTVGAGGEHRFTPNWSVRAEYRYVHFNVNRDSSRPSASANTNATSSSTFTSSALANQSAAFDFHLGKIGIVYTPGATSTAADAYAADLPLKAPRLIASTDPWTGLYVGAHIGAGSGDASTTRTDASASSSTFTTTGFAQTNTSNTAGAARLSGNVTGSVADLFVGYNHRVGSFVFGGQVEGTVFSDVTSKAIGIRSSVGTGTTTNTTGFGTTVNPSSGTSLDTIESFDDLRSMFSVVGRAGWLATPATLLYALGGGTLGHFVVPESQDPFGGKRSTWALGYTAGAGGEQRFTRNWSVRAEYRYVHFDVDRDSSSLFTGTSTGSNSSTSISINRANQSTAFDFHLGKIGIVYTP